MAATVASIAWQSWSEDQFAQAKREHRFVLLDLLYGLAWTAILVHPASVDVVSILEKKRQPLLGLKVTAVATQADTPPRVFTHIKLTYTVSGHLNRKAVEDAVSLSKNKYCSVSKMLEKAATIDYEIVYADGEPEA